MLGKLLLPSLHAHAASVKSAEKKIIIMSCG